MFTKVSFSVFVKCTPSKLTLLDPYELYPSNINNTTAEDLDLRYHRVLDKARNLPFIEVVRDTLEVFSSPACIDDTFFDLFILMAIILIMEPV